MGSTIFKLLRRLREYQFSQSSHHGVCSRHTDLETWGYTSNCRRCMQMTTSNEAAGVPHTAACGYRMRDFLNAEDRIHMQERIIHEKPYIVTGACLDRRRVGLGEGTAT